ncbi:MAG: zinc-binding dehydrogenase [Bacteroidales bacterium]|nr:zinc-binding dehydrogenase [Bacteroidales bacterium]
MFPLTYNAIELPAYNANILRAMLGLRVVEKHIEDLPAGSLLVRMDAAPCNPSDIAFLIGGYNVIKPLPAIPGFEGTGTVVAAGTESQARSLIGRRVSCFSQSATYGTWAEYIVLNINQIIPVDDRLSTEQAAVFFVNPFTAFGLFELAQAKNSKAILVNAAGGRVADFLLAFAKKHEIKTLGIVRKSKTADSLIQKGWDSVLVSTEENFKESLQKKIEEMHVDIAFDAVGGELTGLIAGCMPDDGELVVYGGLSGKEIDGIDSIPLIFRELHLKGFNLNRWFLRAGRQKIAEASLLLTEMLLSGEIDSPVTIQVKPEEIVKGLKHYLGSMSEGKMLLRFT